VSARVLVDEFIPSDNMRRLLRLNRNVAGSPTPNLPTPDQYALFRRYLDARHGEGGMIDMTVLDYAMMVEDSHVETGIIEYREVDAAGQEGPLVAVCLTDFLPDGLSMVYSFFDPNLSKRSLGSFVILDHIARARALGLAHLYLGYWVEGSRKMEYKARFRPQERLMPSGWVRVD
jgi:arginine-tRNA-protein transferase